MDFLLLLSGLDAHLTIREINFRGTTFYNLQRSWPFNLVELRLFFLESISNYVSFSCVEPCKSELKFAGH